MQSLPINPRNTRLRGHFWLGFALLICVPLLSGCVKRRLTIRSDPPGALVYIDDYEVGTTPVSAYYTYYGTRQIRLVLDGYETLTVKQTFYPPWYELPGVDFLTENFIPYEFRDERTLTFKLLPQRLSPPDQLLERAENLRRGSRMQIVPTPNPPVTPGVPLPSQQPVPSGIGGVVPGSLPPR